MKLLAIISTLAVLVMVGCTGLQVGTTFTQPCTIYEVFGATPENSLIASKIANPCAAQKMLATAAKLPAIWGKAEYIAQFNKWAGVIYTRLNEGITYQALQELVVMEVAKFNKEAGLTLLILSDGIFVFGGEVAPIGDVDKRLLLASLNDLRVQVANLSLAIR